MKLYICATYYHVYITLLKQLKDKQNVDIVICDDIPSGNALVERIRNANLFRNVWFVKQRTLPKIQGKNRLDWILFQHRRSFKTIQPLLPFSVHDYDNVYIFHDGTALGRFLNDAHKPYHLIEDSLNFYQRLYDTAQGKGLKHRDTKYRVRRLLNSGYFPLGDSRMVIDIEVNEKKNLQISDTKVVEAPRSALRENLTTEDKNLILHIFGCPRIPNSGSTAALLLTEPLHKDGVVDSTETQLTIYSDMVAELQRRRYSVVLKPHPRDDEVYTFPGVQVLESQFPVELFEYLPVEEFACAATVSSSAIWSIKAKKKLFWKENKFIDIEYER